MQTVLTALWLFASSFAAGVSLQVRPPPAHDGSSCAGLHFPLCPALEMAGLMIMCCQPFSILFSVIPFHKEVTSDINSEFNNSKGTRQLLTRNNTESRKGYLAVTVLLLTLALNILLQTSCLQFVSQNSSDMSMVLLCFYLTALVSVSLTLLLCIKSN